MKWSRESGAALLTTMVVVAALSAVAVAVLADIRRGQQLSANMQNVSQAQWFAIGADAYARVMAERLTSGELPRTALAGPPRIAAFPLDRGMMQVAVSDGSACINLNSVVSGAGDIFERDDVGADQVVALMKLAGIAPGVAENLVSALVDWIDTGGGRVGSDDAPYSRKQPPYLTGGEPLAEFSELRAITGFTPEILARLRPFACVLPQTGPSPVNINALSPERAQVLAALGAGKLSVAQAQKVLARRPPSGWQSLGEAFTDPDLAAAALPERAVAALRLDTRYLAIDVLVLHDDAEVVMSELMARQGSGFVTVSRRWSRDI